MTKPTPSKLLGSEAQGRLAVCQRRNCLRTGALAVAAARATMLRTGPARACNGHTPELCPGAWSVLYYIYVVRCLDARQCGPPPRRLTTVRWRFLPGEALAVRGEANGEAHPTAGQLALQLGTYCISHVRTHVHVHVLGGCRGLPPTPSTLYWGSKGKPLPSSHRSLARCQAESTERLTAKE